MFGMKSYKHTVQIFNSDCGTACVKSILDFYGYNVDYTKIRKKINNRSNGTELYNIKKFFLENNIDSKIYKINDLVKEKNFSNISNDNLPCILFLKNDNLNHYIVIYEFLKNGKCIISDPLHPKLEKIYLKKIIDTAYYIISVKIKKETKIDNDLIMDIKDRNIFKEILKEHKKKLINLTIISVSIVFVNILLSSVLGLFIDYILPNINILNNLMIYIIIIIYLIFSFSDTYFNYLKIDCVQNITNIVEYDLYTKYIKKILEFRPSIINEIHSGELVNRLKEGMSIVNLISTILTRIVIDFILIIIAEIILLLINKYLGIINFFMCTLSFIIVKLYFNRMLENSYQVSKSYAELDNELISIITNLENIKVFNNERKSRILIDNALKKYIKQRNINFKYGKESTSLQNVISQISVFSTILFGMLLIGNKKLTLGALIVFINISGLLAQSVLEIVNIQTEIESQMVSYKRFSLILNIKSHNNRLICNNIIQKVMNIQLVNYSLKYDDNILLLNVNTIFNNHSNIIISGKSGSGKSSLAKSLIGLNDNYTGEILINGKNIKDLTGRYIREKIIYISNDIKIRKGSIIEFLTDGNKMLSKTLLKVCADSNILDFILSLPNQFDYIIETDGRNLSLGQKQRLSIAYAILKDPDVISFDETFSNIDEENKNNILNSLETYNILKIFITHQKMNVKNVKKYEIKNFNVMIREE